MNDWTDEDLVGVDRVAETTINGYWVSTVRLGFPLGPGGEYETMVFAIEDENRVNYTDLYCERYATPAQAAEGHKIVVNLVKIGDIP